MGLGEDARAVLTPFSIAFPSASAPDHCVRPAQMGSCLTLCSSSHVLVLHRGLFSFSFRGLMGHY